MLPAEQAAVLDAALELVRAALDRQAAADAAADASAEASSPQKPPLEAVEGRSDASAEAPPPQPATLADAFLSMAQTVLAAAPPAAARKAKAQLIAQVDPLTGWARLGDGELLPPTSLRSVLTTLPGRGGPLRLRPITDTDVRRHDLGRTRHLPSTALRELLGSLDGERCRFPGCTRHRSLHAHHARFWRDRASPTWTT